MQPFTLSEPPDLRSALAAHAGAAGARYLAGGTTLVDLMKLYVEAPTSVVADKFYSRANERLRILGEIPVRKFAGSPGTAQPVDPDGNPVLFDQHV